MNPFSAHKGTLLGVLIAVGFSSGLAAAELHDGSQQNNGLTAAQLQLIGQEACPYPPQTPAAAGKQGESLQPGMNRQPAPSLRPAIYIELWAPTDADDNVIITI